ncbi:hypothetical protein EV421DRAFT_2020526 [Armillaria borealis]|uniref:Uncharacterized protein n=1 Tax=Armillaria borealis TaxID=47425 RepID=A0AA39MNP4_9AGAR|nr:hypothetical protein EV421DRAFT_2020526 [Armillaria borealis]
MANNAARLVVIRSLPTTSTPADPFPFPRGYPVRRRRAEGPWRLRTVTTVPQFTMQEHHDTFTSDAPAQSKHQGLPPFPGPLYLFPRDVAMTTDDSHHGHGTVLRQILRWCLDSWVATSSSIVKLFLNARYWSNRLPCVEGLGPISNVVLTPESSGRIGSSLVSQDSDDVLIQDRAVAPKMQLVFVRVTIQLLGVTWIPNLIGRIGWLRDPLCVGIYGLARKALLTKIWPTLIWNSSKTHSVVNPNLPVQGQLFVSSHGSPRPHIALQGPISNPGLNSTVAWENAISKNPVFVVSSKMHAMKQRHLMFRDMIIDW